MGDSPTIKDLQAKVLKIYLKAFGRTPLQQRLDDILGEAMELHRYSDIANLREEAGDLLSSLLQLMNENGWIAEDVLTENLAKIKRRELQYQGLGRKLKVAILGGAFDMITTGHIQVAKFILSTSKRFDSVWLMPCFEHMYNKRMKSPEHRLAMCELAVQGDPRIKVCSFEIANKLRGETYHMVKKFLDTDEGKNQVDISLVIGLDNANTCEEGWVNFRELERMIPFVVIPRTGENRKAGVNWYLRPPHLYLEPDKPLIEICSTEVRDAVGVYWKHKNLGQLINFSFGMTNAKVVIDKGLDPKVFNYIVKNRLYLPTDLK